MPIRSTLPRGPAYSNNVALAPSLGRRFETLLAVAVTAFGATVSWAASANAQVNYVRSEVITVPDFLGDSVDHVGAQNLSGWHFWIRHGSSLWTMYGDYAKWNYIGTFDTTPIGVAFTQAGLEVFERTGVIHQFDTSGELRARAEVQPRPVGAIQAVKTDSTWYLLTSDHGRQQIWGIRGNSEARILVHLMDPEALLHPSTLSVDSSVRL
jgi:hypothetical protein